MRINAFLLALCISLALALLVVTKWPLQHAPQAPQVQAEQQAYSAVQRGQHAQTSGDPAALPNKPNSPKHGEEGDEEGSEFWPPFFGYRLKITDTLLVAFTFLLTVFTGLLWKSTDKLWAAGEKQALITRDMLIGDQRAWIVTSLEIGTDGMSLGEAYTNVDVRLKVTNVGRTAAIHAHTNMKMIGSLDDLTETVKAFCAENNAKAPFHGRLVSPNETYWRPWVPGASNDVFYKYGRNDDINVIIIGCVTYEILQDQQTHQTAFAYLLGRKVDTPGWGGGCIYFTDKSLKPDDIEVFTAMGGFAS